MDQSMRSDAMSIFSDAVKTSVTVGSCVVRYLFYAAVFINLIVMFMLLQKISQNAPSKGRVTMV